MEMYEEYAIGTSYTLHTYLITKQSRNTGLILEQGYFKSNQIAEHFDLKPSEVNYLSTTGHLQLEDFWFVSTRVPR